MATQLQNTWHVRTVAEASSKACFICYRPTTKVMITPDNKDFFYVCAAHITDPGFACPIVDKEAEEAKRKKEEMDREIEIVKKEYEEKQRKKKGKKKNKDDKDKDAKKEDEDDSKAEKERDDKISSIQAGTGAAAKPDDGPRIYALQKSFYQMRVDRLRNIEIAKRNQQRLKEPSLFPSVPKGDLL